MKISEIITEDRQLDESSDPILDFINRSEQSHELSSGNCGILAIALNEKFGMDNFLFVENEVEPDRLYHVASYKNGKIYDADGITTLDQIKRRGFDDDYPESDPRIVEVPANKDFYRYIVRGTEPNIDISDLLNQGVAEAELDEAKRKRKKAKSKRRSASSNRSPVPRFYGAWGFGGGGEGDGGGE
jgi:hypothetical protein